MKSIMLSIKPPYCELIASGKKTVEVRKTRPKIETPFKCYIYCTNGKSFYIFDERFECETKGNGKVIGEFLCDKIVWVISHPTIFAGHDLFHEAAIKAACLTDNEAEKYAKGKDLYGWHISDLVIYDKPRELSEFVKPCIYGEESERPCFTCDKSGYASDMHIDCFNTVTRPPQSWCYVEELICPF